MLKLLGSAAEPIYAVDEKRRVVYCNSACGRWLRLDPERLVGATCVWQALPDASDPVALAAAALCPPPQAFAEPPPPGPGNASSDPPNAAGEITARLVWPGRDGTTQRWPARFIPLARLTGESLGVLAIVERLPLAEHTANPPTEAAALHEQLRRFHATLSQGGHFGRLIGDSPAMQLVRRQVKLAAGSNAGVVIVGPTGSRRQLIARAIHVQSPAAQAGSFVPLDCGLLTTEQFVDALRTMTVAGSPRKTLRAGTILLSDVERLPRDAQRILAAAWDQPDFTPRVIATARQPLDELPPQERLIPELTSRLSVLVVRAPALVERLDDVPLLAQSALEDCNTADSKQLAGFTEEALDWLANYTWPGDLSELIEVVRTTHETAKGPLIRLSDLPRFLRHAHDAAVHPRKSPEPIDLEATLAQVERELIERALELARNNKSKAAQLLGTTRPKLYRRLVQLGLIDESAGGE
ncbi:MAG TPA: helix-turn-helix domain-containing protein, partial [Pirellulales bacterium]